MIKVPKSLEINDSDLLLQNAIQGAGIAYLPAFIVEPALAEHRLERVLEDYETSIWSLNVYYHPPTKASAVASHFKTFLLEDNG